MVLLTQQVDGRDLYQELGSHFHLIQKEVSPEHFKTTSEIIATGDGVYAFIVYNDGKDIEPLYKGTGNFILTQSGSLFKDVTYK